MFAEVQKVRNDKVTRIPELDLNDMQENIGLTCNRLVNVGLRVILDEVTVLLSSTRNALIVLRT